MHLEEPLPPAELGAGEREGILARIRAAVAAVPEIRLGYAFGSFVRGEPFRDIDVAVLLDEPISWRVSARVGDALRGAMGPLPRPLDVVELNAASPTFRLRVASEGIVVCERNPREAIEFWVRAKSEVLDLEAWHRAHERDVRGPS